MTYDFLQDDIVIICSNNIKSRLINYCVENKKVFNIKYFTLDNFFNNLTFSYNEETIVKIKDNFNLNIEVAKNYLDNIKYLVDEEKDDKRIKFLIEIKNFCEENNLLVKNKNFKYLIQNKKILFVGIDYINKYQKKVLDINNIKYEIINLRETKKTSVINEFNNIEDEIHYVANQILSLVEKGIDIHKIFVANINDNYNYVIKKIFKIYNIPFNEKGSSTLYETSIGKYFLDNIDSDINKSIDLLKDKYKNGTTLINQIIDILNKYSFIKDFTLYKDVLIYEFKKARLETVLYDKASNIIPLRDNVILDDEYVFLVGFNLGVIPNIFKNEDYLSDEIKFSYMEKTDEKNTLEKNIWKEIISSIKNINISYSLNYLSESLYPSSLIEEMGLEIIKRKRVISKYSDLANQILLSMELDEYYKFGYVNENLKELINTYSTNYNTFDNKYKGINNFDNQIVLSYSSMNTYYKCAFRYFLANILKIDIYNENFSQYVGNLFHFCLQHYYDGNKNIDELYDNYIKENIYEFNEKEKYFVSVLKEEIHFIIKTIDRQNELSQFKDLKLEEKFVINYGNDVFKGFVDKILYKGKDIVIIDYKTGSIDIDLSLIPHGLSLQLPVYLYLAKKNNPDARIIGFYLQYILNNKMRKSSGKSYETLKKDALKLQGYSLGEESILSEFDESFRDSEVIKGMKLGKNGFYHYSKVLSESEMDKIINMVDVKINEALKNIKDAKFDINPKIVNGKDKGCEFCKFKDICFKSEKDKVYLDVDTTCSYLGGDC